MTGAGCLFCGIIEHRIPAHIVHDESAVVGFKDAHPQAPVHYLLVPRRHVGSLRELESCGEDLSGALIAAAGRIAEREGLDRSGYRLVVNQGRDGGQTVDHLHVHLLGGRSMSWPPG